MYEMEGPRLAAAALACQLPGCRAPRGCHWPHASAAISSLPDLPASRGFPQVQHVFSGESSSTANSAQHTRPLRAPLQDSLVVHRTSAVYPLCAPAFHRPIHTVVHSLDTVTARRPGSEWPRSLGRGNSEAGRRCWWTERTGEPHLTEGTLVGTDRKPVRAALAARDRGQGRLRAVTVAIGAASVLAGGGIALGLPAAAHTQSSASSHSQKSNSGSSASGSSSSTSPSPSSSKSSSSGLQSSSAPSSSSGSGQVTSGGS